MSDDPTKNPPAEGGTPAPSELTNLKAEMNRKLDNTNAQLNAVLEQLKAARAPAAPQAPATAPKAFEDVVYDDPKAAKELLKKELMAEFNEASSRQSQQTQKLQATVQRIFSEYPEFNDESNEVTKRAREIYATYAPEDQGPMALEAAARSAASEYGLKPKSKRTQNDDSFQLSGSASGARPAKKKDEIDDETLLIAQLMGRDLDDPKVKERLKQSASRKNWKNYR
jgi:hypothetical protein